MRHCYVAPTNDSLINQIHLLPWNVQSLRAIPHPREPTPDPLLLAHPAFRATHLQLIAILTD